MERYYWVGVQAASPPPWEGQLGTHWLSVADQVGFYGAEEGPQSLMNQAPCFTGWTGEASVVWWVRVVSDEYQPQQ